MNFNSEIANKIWFTSDTHYWHKNIVYGDSVWKDKETSCRYFDTTQEMSRHIVEQINKYVKEDDLLFNLGDWSFSGIQNIWNFRKQLNVKTIYQINGNHDHHIRKNKLLPNDDLDLNIKTTQDIFNSVADYLEIFIEDRLFCLMHYPLEFWNEQRNDSIMLHGHIHGERYYLKNRLDVGIDNAYKIFGEYRPFNYNDVLEILKNRQYE